MLFEFISEIITIFAPLNSKFSIMRAQILLFWCFLSFSAQAQDVHAWEQYLNQVMSIDDVESSSWERTYDLLCDLEQHPLDLNRASREQLEAIPFLSALQIEELIEYRYHYGAMKSLGELRMLRSFNEPQRTLLTYFIYLGDEEAPRQFAHHELVGTFRAPFYERKGDADGYLGYPYRHWLRYQFTYGNDAKLGLVCAQDAGEPFFSNRNRWGYDYYSPYLQLNNLGRLETLTLGNFRVSLGMGLVINHSFGLGKLAMLQNLGRTTHTLRAHSSRSGDYLQGVGATVRLTRPLLLTAFASYTPMDATLNKDATARTILTDGYHRTETEMAKKHNLHAMKAGGSLRFQSHGFHMSLNTLYTRLDRMLCPDTSALYRRHAPIGRSFLNTSLDYGLVTPTLAFNGETAVDQQGHLATINTLSLRLSQPLTLMAIQRFYTYSYASLDAQSFSDGGKVQNESGLYLGLSWQPHPRFRLVAYGDFAYFAWAKYQVSQSSRSFDQLLQATYTTRRFNFNMRYRLRIRQKDNAAKTALLTQPEHRFRLSADYTGGSGFGCATQIDGVLLTEGEWGTMVSQRLSYENRWLRLQGGFGYFHTDSYESRVYSYERGSLYTYSLSQFYGQGIRYWFLSRVSLSSNLSFTVKLGVTNYFDRDHIGSSYQQINASSLSDLDLQLRWRI